MTNIYNLSTSPTRVLVVDNSRTMRALIRRSLEAHRLHVVGEAPNARIARLLIDALEPDALTLGVELPDMNGLDFLDEVSREHSVPVVMFSGRMQDGSPEAQRATSLGAFASLPKPRAASESSGFRDLAVLVRAACHAGVKRRRNFTKREDLTNQASSNGSMQTGRYLNTAGI